VEALALTVPNPDSARAILRRLTEEPHEAGTVAGYETAVYVRDRLREWGWEAEFAEYEVLLNEPDGLTSVTILQPDRVELKVIEDPNPLDKDSASPNAWPTSRLWTTWGSTWPGRSSWHATGRSFGA
jgi:N-acetylated-alpha-linked acidic dipeptidase